MAACSRTPGPFCQEERPVWIDTGTLCLVETPSPASRLDLFTGPAGRTPHIPYVESDDVSFELADAPRMCVATSLTNLSLAQMRVLAWLREHRSEIVAAEERFQVDRRAIAGAIAWEALMNVRGSWTQAMGRAVGAGKPHVRRDLVPWELLFDRTDTTIVEQVEDADWLPPEQQIPRRSRAARQRVLETSNGSITYMAAAMNAASSLATQAGFPSIRQRPEVLTYFWQKKDLTSWQQHLKGKKQGSDFQTGPDPTVDMDRWVSRNLRYLEDAVGTPRFKDE
jgi:hypothetical protein